MNESGMTGRELMLFLIFLFAIVLPLMIGFTLWFVLRLRRRADRAPSADDLGGLDVPVRGLRRDFRFLGYSKNSINPRLAIDDHGLSFRVFKPDHWPFGSIATIDVPTTLFGARLIIRHRSEGTLAISLADAARAGDLLRRLPSDLRYSHRASALRAQA